MGCKRDRYGKQKRRRDESEFYTCESSDSLNKKRISSRKISEEEIKEYLAKKAQKKASDAAKKLKVSEAIFVWKKKIEKDVVDHGASLHELFSVKSERRRYKARMAEAEKVKKRKEERAVEKARHDENMALLARERARSEFQDLEKKEKEFLFDQGKVRSKMRLSQGRAKPIDFLLLYNHSLDLDGLDNIKLLEPYMVFKGLITLKDMEELSDDIKTYMDWDRANIEYWEAVNVLCDWELGKARKREERGVHAVVEAEVRKLLDGKTHTELVQLQLDIESDLRSGLAKVVEFWETVLKHIDIYKAKAFLKEIHAENRHEDTNGMNHSEEEEEEETVEDSLELKAAMEEGSDAIYAHEVNLDDSHEYRPIKPKYSNRVHTSYEWNKYNRTHYDHDDPPPKIVQGYKFNIFYPDLVDKNRAPTCTILKDGTSDETCLVRFQAGPPYQDIVFRIVNKEWEYSHKKGYKCTFERGIMHLHFNFKRHPYKR